MAIISILGGLAPGYGDEPRDTAQTARLIVPGPAGASFDRYARLVAKHIGRHLPGTPNVLVQNMPGASGQVALRWLNTTAPKDGSVFGFMLKQMPLMQRISTEPVQYKVEDLGYIGSPATLAEVLVVRSELGATSIHDLVGKEVKIGATTGSGATVIMPLLLNEVLGTKFKIVKGYQGANQTMVALERGEIDGMAGMAWSEWKSTRPDLAFGRKIIPLAQMGLNRHRDLPHVPLLSSFAPHDEALRMASLTAAMGRPMIAPPGMDVDRLWTLRHAFLMTMYDTTFRRDAEAQGVEINPIDGDRLVEVVEEILKASPTAVARLHHAIKE